MLLRSRSLLNIFFGMLVATLVLSTFSVARADDTVDPRPGETPGETPDTPSPTDEDSPDGTDEGSADGTETPPAPEETPEPETDESEGPAPAQAPQAASLPPDEWMPYAGKPRKVRPTVTGGWVRLNLTPVNGKADDGTPYACSRFDVGPGANECWVTLTRWDPSWTYRWVRAVNQNADPNGPTSFQYGDNLGITLLIKLPDGTPGANRAIQYTIYAKNADGTVDQGRSSVGTIVVEPQYKKAPDNYNPGDKGHFSHPHDRTRGTIERHLIRMINSATPGSKIRIFTWTFRSVPTERALYNAKRRGVHIQVLMGRIKESTGLQPNFSLSWLGHNRNAQSFAYACQGPCRGHGGVPHSKIMLFSQVGKTPWVTMTQSGNVTPAASDRQYNQSFTTTGGALPMKLRTLGDPPYDDPDAPPAQLRSKANYEAFKFSDQVFQRSKRDVKDSFRTKAFGEPGNRWQRLWYNPTWGNHNFQLVDLNKVECHNGGTQIRVAMFAWFGRPGDWSYAIARRLKQLRNEGCQVLIVYGQMSPTIRNVLSGIPKRVIWAANEEGNPTLNIHLKYLTVRLPLGKTMTIEGKKNTRCLTHQGSSNFSVEANSADENTQRILLCPETAQFERDFNDVYRVARAG